MAGLESAGVEVCFGLPGVHNLAAWRALDGSSIRLIGVRHEQTAVYAADGYARASGDVGVAITTTGPGAANTLGAVGEAWASGSPVVVIATDIPTSMRRPGVHRRRAARGLRPGGHVRAGDEGDAEGRRRRGCSERRSPRDRDGRGGAGRPVYVGVPDRPAVRRGRAAGGGRRRPPTAPLPVRTRRSWTAPPPCSAPPRARSCGPAAARARGRAGRGGRACRAARRAGDHDLHGARPAGRRPPVRGRPAAAPARRRAAVGQADVVLAVGSDFDGMMTQNWAMPAPPQLVAINVDPVDAAKNYSPDVVDRGRRRARCARRWPRGSAARRPGRLRRALAGRCATSARRGCGRRAPDELRFLERSPPRRPRRRRGRRRHVHPGLLARRLPPPCRAAALAYPMGWGTLGFAFPAAIGAARRARPARLRLAATAASSSPAASWRRSRRSASR